MTHTIELTPVAEVLLEQEAARKDLAVDDYLRELVEEALASAAPRPRTGAELVARLKEEGILGMWADRKDIGDSVEFARKLRRQAETRGND